MLGRRANLIPQSACSASNHPFHPHTDFNVKHFTSARDRLIDSPLIPFSSAFSQSHKKKKDMHCAECIGVHASILGSVMIFN